MADAAALKPAVVAAVDSGVLAEADQRNVNDLLRHAASMQNQIMLKEGKDGLMKIKVRYRHTCLPQQQQPFAFCVLRSAFCVLRFASLCLCMIVCMCVCARVYL